MLRFAAAAALSSLLLAGPTASAAPVPSMAMARPQMAMAWQMKKVPRYMWNAGSKIVPSSAPVEVPTCNPLEAILGKGQPVTKVGRRQALGQILNH